MVLKFFGKNPQQKFFQLGVIGNNLVDDLVLLLERMQGDTDLLEFTPYLKIVNNDLSYVDKINDFTIENIDSDDGKPALIKITYKPPDKVTKQKSVDMQLSFEDVVNDGEDTLIWQSAIFNITFDDAIDVSSIINSNYPDILKSLTEQISQIQQNTASIIQYKNKDYFPNIGTANTVYVDAENNKLYRFDTDNNTYYVVGSDYEDIKIINCNGGN